MNKLFLFSILFIATVIARAQQVDTLIPLDVFPPDEFENRTTVEFASTAIPFYATDNETVKNIETAIKKQIPLLVVYDEDANTINKVYPVTISNPDRFYDKYDTFSLGNFNYDPTKNLKKNEMAYISEFKRIQLYRPIEKEIPEDSLAGILENFISLSCENTRNCTARTPCIPFDYKVDGCYARAHYMRKILAEKYHYDCEKIFLHGRLRAVNDGGCKGRCVAWSYHVAPYVAVRKKDNSIVNYVIDPSLDHRPLSQEEWIKLQEQNCGVQGVREKIEIMPSYVYLPDGTHDDNYEMTNKKLHKFCEKCH